MYHSHRKRKTPFEMELALDSKITNYKLLENISI